MILMADSNRRQNCGYSFLSMRPEDTKTFAGCLSLYSFPGLVVFVSGTLGAGKTEFVRGFASRISRDVVRSPSFTLINEYKGDIPIARVDLYRIENDASMELSLEEYVREGFIVLLEWPENWDGGKPSETWTVKLAMPVGPPRGTEGHNIRLVKITCEGETACEHLGQFFSWFCAARREAEG